MAIKPVTSTKIVEAIKDLPTAKRAEVLKSLGIEGDVVELSEKVEKGWWARLKEALTPHMSSEQFDAWQIGTACFGPM